RPSFSRAVSPWSARGFGSTGFRTSPGLFSKPVQLDRHGRFLFRQLAPVNVPSWTAPAVRPPLSPPFSQTRPLQRPPHPVVADPDLMLVPQLLMEMQHALIDSAVSSGIRWMLRFPRRWSNRPSYPNSSYRSFMRRIVRSETPAISVAAVQVIRFAIAF